MTSSSNYVLFKKANLPDPFWNIEGYPRFRTISSSNSLHTASMQASIYQSLMTNTKQLVQGPVMWRVGAYSNPLNYASMTLAQIVKEAIIMGIRVQCALVEDLPKIHENRTDLVFCYGVYSDLEPCYLKLIRDAQTKNYNFFYAVDAPYKEAMESIRFLPDVALNIANVDLKLTQARVV